MSALADGSLSHISRCTAWHVGVTVIHHTFSFQRGCVFSVQMEHLIITYFWAVLSQRLKRWASKPSLLIANFLINPTVSKQLFKRSIAFGKFYAGLKHLFCNQIMWDYESFVALSHRTDTAIKQKLLLYIIIWAIVKNENFYPTQQWAVYSISCIRHIHALFQPLIMLKTLRGIS